MGIRLIRENSDTPNVTNMDDARMARYAYGGYNGFVQGKGRELDCEGNGTDTLTINSGVIVLQGWEVEVDSNGWDMKISASNHDLIYYTVYCEVNLSVGAAASIKSTYAESDFPVISAGDDLTKKPNGIARIELCHFTAQKGTIINVQKIISKIPYEKNELYDQIESVETKLQDGSLIPKKSTEATKVNGVIIQKSENGTLIIDGNIIPQKSILWEGNKYIDLTQGSTAGRIVLQKDWNRQDGDVLEVRVSTSTTSMIFKAWYKGKGYGSNGLLSYGTVGQVEEYILSFYEFPITLVMKEVGSSELDYLSVGPVINGNVKKIYDNYSAKYITEYTRTETKQFYLEQIVLIRS